MVRACCIPFSPYHSRSLIWPVPNGKQWVSRNSEPHDKRGKELKSLPVESVVLSKAVGTGQYRLWLQKKSQSYMDHGTSEQHHLLIRVRLHWKVTRRDKVMSCSNTALNAFRTVTYGGLEACERILWEPWWSLSMAAQQQQKCAIG